jgi:hypothetical protein
MWENTTSQVSSEIDDARSARVNGSHPDARSALRKAEHGSTRNH